MGITDSTRVADILDAAANLVDMAGWCQGQMVADDGVCALGALHVTGQVLAERFVAAQSLAVTLAEQFPANCPGCPDRSGVCAALVPEAVIIHINDHHAVSGDEMAACMRKAANSVRWQA